jgi:hypothetical protein
VLRNLSKLEDASYSYDDHDHCTRYCCNQKHDGGGGMAVKTDEVDRGSLSVFSNEDDQKDENKYGSDDCCPACADSGRGDVLRGRWLHAQIRTARGMIL